MAETLDYTIENVGGVSRAELSLKPGVNVLRGENGLGKSSAIAAVSRASGGAEGLEKRDGTAQGTVEGPGVKLRVGKVVTTKGQADLALDDVSPLSRLIDPGIADSEKANAARIRELAKMLGLEVDADTERILTAGEPELQGVVEVGADLFAASEQVRRKANELANTEETAAKEEAGRVSAASERQARLLESLGGVDNLSQTGVEEAREEMERVTEEHARQTVACERREALEDQQREVRQTLGDRPDAEAASDFAATSRREADDAEEIVQNLREQLAAAEESARAKDQAAQRAAEAADDVSLRAQRWDEAKAVLDQEPEGPTRSELEAMHASKVAVAQADLERARQSEEYRRCEHEWAEAENAREAHEERAVGLRLIARTQAEKLGELLSRAGAPGVTIEAGRLCAIIDGKPQDFEKRLSDGQRVRAAMDVWMSVGHGVAALSPEWWGSLDPANREAVAKAASERDLYLLTEEPAEGQMRLEHLGDAA